ncbi:MAG: hypothetical protein M3081_08800 [Gemmatimonadota bacterium]|nr:hypothetical protein [Gemmatimonadota bacterium]
MIRFCAASVLLLATAAMPTPTHASRNVPMSAHVMTKLSPVLIVDAVEPCLAFWTERLGFKSDNLVPGSDGKLIFAGVEKDGVEIMYQTRASVLAEDPKRGEELNGRSVVLFIQLGSLADLDGVERAVAGAPVVKARHKTFYGTTEIYLREPGGNVVGFAAK